MRRPCWTGRFVPASPLTCADHLLSPRHRHPSPKSKTRGLARFQTGSGLTSFSCIRCDRSTNHLHAPRRRTGIIGDDLPGAQRTDPSESRREPFIRRILDPPALLALTVGLYRSAGSHHARLCRLMCSVLTAKQVVSRHIADHRKPTAHVAIQCNTRRPTRLCSPYRQYVFELLLRTPARRAREPEDLPRSRPAPALERRAASACSYAA